jgi:hypothetical protein
MVLEEALWAGKETANPALQSFGVAYSDLSLLLLWLSSYSPTLNMAHKMGVCVDNCQLWKRRARGDFPSFHISLNF